MNNTKIFSLEAESYMDALIVSNQLTLLNSEDILSYLIIVIIVIIIVIIIIIIIIIIILIITIIIIIISVCLQLI